MNACTRTLLDKWIPKYDKTLLESRTDVRSRRIVAALADLASADLLATKLTVNSCGHIAEGFDTSFGHRNAKRTSRSCGWRTKLRLHTVKRHFAS